METVESENFKIVVEILDWKGGRRRYRSIYFECAGSKYFINFEKTWLFIDFIADWPVISQSVVGWFTYKLLKIESSVVDFNTKQVRTISG